MANHITNAFNGIILSNSSVIFVYGEVKIVTLGLNIS